MSTSLLYHAFGVWGYTLVSKIFDNGKVTFKIKGQRDDLHCPVCKSDDVILRGSNPRMYRTFPIGRNPNQNRIDFCKRWITLLQTEVKRLENETDLLKEAEDALSRIIG